MYRLDGVYIINAVYVMSLTSEFVCLVLRGLCPDLLLKKGHGSLMAALLFLRIIRSHSAMPPVVNVLPMELLVYPPLS